MIAPGPATRIFLAPGTTDLRRSFDGLYDLVRSQLPARRRLGRGRLDGEAAGYSAFHYCPVKVLMTAISFR